MIGTGDGGAYTTAPDMIRFWHALLDGRIVPRPLVDRMTTVNVRAEIDRSESKHSYGLGFWLGPDGATVVLEGEDAGVSFRSGTDLATGLTFCFIANNATDVWPLATIVDR